MYKTADWLKACSADIYFGGSTADCYCLGYTLGVSEAPRVNTKTRLDFFGQHREILYDYFIELHINFASISSRARNLFWRLGYLVGSSDKLDVPIGLELGTEVRDILWIKPLDTSLPIVKYPCAYPKPSGEVPYAYSNQMILPVTFVCVRSFRTNSLREEYKQS